MSVERVVAGPAISDIYQTLAALEGRPVAEEDDIAIWTRGQDGSDSLAAAAVDRFCMSLGSVAGDIALAQGGFGGVVMERLCTALADLGHRTLVVDAADTASLPHELAPVDLSACIERLSQAFSPSRSTVTRSQISCTSSSL